MTATVSLYSPYTPEAMDFMAPLSAPTRAHLLGTDNFGRDILTRVLYGYQISLAVALGSVGFGLAVGGALGMLAGYFGGLVDNIIMRPMDVLMAFPAIVLVVALTGFVGREITVMIMAVAVVYVPIFARVMRGSTLEVVNELFVEGRAGARRIAPAADVPAYSAQRHRAGADTSLDPDGHRHPAGIGAELHRPGHAAARSVVGADAVGRAVLHAAGALDGDGAGPGDFSIAVLGFNLLGNGLQELCLILRGRADEPAVRAQSDHRIQCWRAAGWRRSPMSASSWSGARSSDWSANRAAANPPSPTASCACWPTMPASAAAKSGWKMSTCWI